MKTILRAFAVAATLLLSAIPAFAHEGHLPWTDATVRKVDAAAGKVTLAHGRIANLDMSAMTMSFKARDPAVLKKLKEGDKVRFKAADVGGVLTVLVIEAAK
jgi:Cu(I)/Ag(I) efflux system protein CusF